MLRRPTPTLAILSLLGLLSATIAPALGTEYRADGPLAVQFTKSQMTAPAVARTGDQEFAVEFRVGWIDSFGVPALSPVTLVRNASVQPLFYASYSAFFDNEGKLIAASGGWLERAIKPGETDYSICFLVDLTKEVIANVASYQLVVYRSDKVVGGDASDQQPPVWPGPRRHDRPHVTPIQFGAMKARDEEAAPVTGRWRGQLELACRFHAYPNAGWRVFAGGQVVNPTAQRAAFCYNVAIFDDDGRLIAAAQEDQSSFKARDTWRIRQSVAVPRERLLSMRAYQVAFYESVGGAPLSLVGELKQPDTKDAAQ